MISYEELAERLASDLPFLRYNDFVTLRSATGYVQVIQDPDRLLAELSIRRPLSGDEQQALIAQGWQPPRPGEPTWLRTAAWPLSADSARHLAAVMLEAAQTFLAADTAGLEYNASNYDTWEPLDLASVRDLRRALD